VTTKLDGAYSAFKSNDKNTGTSKDSTNPFINENIPVCIPAELITSGKRESIVAAPPGAIHINLCQRASKGINTKEETSLIILAKKAMAPNSVLCIVLITTEDKLYQPKPLATKIES
jgi:hypothetical protein